MPENNQLETLKTILENSLQPQRLDTHPWTNSLIVLASGTESSELQDKSLGQQLVIAIGKIFTQMMPRTAPRHGKRLDTSWGEFGILAAQYFAPLNFGAPAPDSLREAWGRIDQSILYFVYGKLETSLSAKEKENYKLVGDELEVAPNSTLSDWHRKGLQRLLDMIVARENYLSKTLSKPAVISPEGQKIIQEENPSQVAEPKKRSLNFKLSGKWRFLPGLILLGLVLICGFKAWRIYNLAMLVRQDATQLRDLVKAPAPSVEQARQVGPPLSMLHKDFAALKTEAEPFFWLGPWLKWAPLYGGELASIQDLATIADSTLASADIAYSALLPVVEEYGASGFKAPRLTELLGQAQPQLTESRRRLELAIAARSRLEPARLSPQARDVILNTIDPLLVSMQDGLTLAVELPRMLGATSEGPKTYLLLVQNEDELRPTGGFITAAGALLMQGGQISALTFDDSGNLDNWSKLYPAAPWQLNQYMNSPVLVLRDANWFTNYPTAALYAEYLYSYSNAHSVDGVIAFDQQLLVKVLSATGPIQVDGVDYPIDVGNVIAYMRAAKIQMDPGGSGRAGGQDKAFMSRLTAALTDKILHGNVEPEKLVTVFLQVLDEHHILLQLDNPSMTSLLARRHWDGAVRPGTGDFLMVVDTNIGFNKTNAVVESSLVYDVDLTKPSTPIGSLTVVHKNNANGVLVCKQWNKIRMAGEEDYPITDCYWNYLRIYMPKGTQLLDATPQSIPAGWMIRNQSIPAKVDTLQDEEMDGVQAFGSLQVVPIGESLMASFRFALPVGILKINSGSSQTYHLKVQKQPGTLAVPIIIRMHFPNGATIYTVPDGAIVQGQNIFLETNLRTDIEFEIVFDAP